MATAKRETIIDAVVTRLESITTGNGYEQTVRKVYRPHEDVTTITQYPCIVLRDMGETRSRRSRGTQCRLSLAALGFVRDGQDSSRTEASNDIAADIVKAVYTGTSPLGETWSSNAVETYAEEIDPADVRLLDPRAKAGVMLAIIYRVKTGDPFTGVTF